MNYLDNFRKLDFVFDSVFDTTTYFTSEDADSYYLELELPGYIKEDISIENKGNILNIKGNSTRKGREYRIDRNFKIPYFIDIDTISAEMKNGILTIMFPKCEKDNKKLITIN